MKIFIDKSGEKKEILFDGPVHELLDKLGINKESVIVVREGELLTHDDLLKDSDSVKIMSVVSGG